MIGYDTTLEGFVDVVTLKADFLKDAEFAIYASTNCFEMVENTKKGIREAVPRYMGHKDVGSVHCLSHNYPVLH